MGNVYTYMLMSISSVDCWIVQTRFAGKSTIYFDDFSIYRCCCFPYFRYLDQPNTLQKMGKYKTNMGLKHHFYGYLEGLGK